MSKSQRRVARYAALAVDDLTHSVGWDRDLTRQFSRRNAERLKLIGEDFPWMYDRPGHLAANFTSLTIRTKACPL